MYFDGVPVSLKVEFCFCWFYFSSKCMKTRHQIIHYLLFLPLSIGTVFFQTILVSQYLFLIFAPLNLMTMPSSISMLNFEMLLPPRGFRRGREQKRPNPNVPCIFTLIPTADTHKKEDMPQNTYLEKFSFIGNTYNL